jgi:hypothetical protein
MMTLDEFFAEAKRLNLTAFDLVPQLTMRPEFDDCLSHDFRQVKNAIMAMPEQHLREFAIAQAIQLQFHEKYGNAMANANAAFAAEQQAAAGVDSTRADQSKGGA